MVLDVVCIALYHGIGAASIALHDDLATALQGKRACHFTMRYARLVPGTLRHRSNFRSQP